VRLIGREIWYMLLVATFVRQYTDETSNWDFAVHHVCDLHVGLSLL